jgi:hypothetical protein
MAPNMLPVAVAFASISHRMIEVNMADGMQKDWRELVLRSK